MKRQLPGNRIHSAHLWVVSKASVEALEQSPSFARLGKRTSLADNPARRFAAQNRKAGADRPHSPRLLARSRSGAPPCRAEPQKTRSRAAQSQPDRGVPPPMATHSRPSVFFPVRPTMPASRPQKYHLYSWYWSTFTFSSTPMASSVRTAIEQ